jgi:hypothetical protein
VGHAEPDDRAVAERGDLVSEPQTWTRVVEPPVGTVVGPLNEYDGSRWKRVTDLEGVDARWAALAAGRETPVRYTFGGILEMCGTVREYPDPADPDDRQQELDALRAKVAELSDVEARSSTALRSELVAARQSGEAWRKEAEHWKALATADGPGVARDGGAHHGGFFVYRSENGSDPWSTLSLHRIGEDIHLRLQHDGSIEYAVAVLPPGEPHHLAVALTGDARFGGDS